MPIFYDRIDPADNEAFLSWVSANPGGYYLNQKKAAEAMMHRGKCFHIEFKVPVRLTATRKIASTNRESLQQWATAEDIQITVGSDCI